LLARDVGRRLSGEGFEVESVDVRDLPADALMFGRAETKEVHQALALIDRASGVVIATPVYKAAYSGLLKAFIDMLPQLGLSGKVILPLAVGGSLAHVLAIDYGLRPVLCSMAAQHVVNGVFVLDKLLTRSTEGDLHIESGIENLLQAAVGDFVASLRRRLAVH
jgi:FMN reductase